MKKIIKHIQRWNIWRKNNLNGPLYKFLVLIGLMKSPSMPLTWTPDEIKEIVKSNWSGYPGSNEYFPMVYIAPKEEGQEE